MNRTKNKKVFDISKSEFIRQKKAKLEKKLKRNKGGNHIEILDLELDFNRKNGGYLETIYFAVYYDDKHREMIYKDYLREFLKIRENATLSMQLVNDNDSLLNYNVERLLNIVKLARKAYKIFIRNSKEEIVPLIMMVC